jgi:hypothetical protein
MMDNASAIAITDVLDYELVECTWGEFATDNLESGGMEIEELNQIESALDKNEPYFIGQGGGGGWLITRLN